MKPQTKRKLLITGSLLLAAGAITGGMLLLRKLLRTIPKGVEPVTPFEINRFLGKWYVVAHANHPDEQSLKNSLFEFLLSRDNTIEVYHRGYNAADGQTNEKRGTAFFTGDSSIGELKISFKGTFLYAGYNIMELDPEYKWAIVGGEDRKRLWLLSRRPDMLDEVAEQYLAIAGSYGYDVANMVWVEHEE